MKVKLVFIIFYLFISLNYYSQTINTAIENFISKIEFKNSNIGFYVENLKTKEVVFKKNENISMIPASIFKVFPTSYALELFGPTHKFKTEIYYSGSIDSEGTLTGDLYIVGGGDPCLGSQSYTYNYEKNNKDIFQQWIEEILKKGIKKINGNIISDISYFGKINIPERWIWQDIDNFYGNEGSALNYMDNLYFLHFATGANNGDNTKITYIVPSDLNINFKNYVTSSSYNGDEAYIFKGDGNYNKEIRGTLPIGKTDFVIKGSMPEPELFVANLLFKSLKNNNINISGETKVINVSDNKTKTLITTTYSPDLLNIITNINQKSNNLYAQILSYHIAKKLNKTYSSAILDYLKTNKINTDGLYVDDACGLSHFNTLTAKLMVEYLKFIKNNFIQTDNFINSLPIAGVSGTLRNLSVGNNVKVVAKSGSMFKVASYCGYISNSKGEEYVFCFIVNNFNGPYYNVQKYFTELFKNF